MSKIKKGTITNAGYVKDVKKDKSKGAVTITLSPEPPEPDWKEIATELFSIVDDIGLFLHPEKDSHEFQFLQKKIRQAGKHFILYEGVVYSRIDFEEWEKQKREMLSQIFERPSKPTKQ